VTTFSDRFGRWSKLPGAFRAFAAQLPDWEDVLPLAKPPSRAGRALKSRKRSETRLKHRERIPRRLSGTRSALKLAPLSNGRPICGGPLEAGGLRHAPVNEQGVVFLFGVLAERLGFLVDGIRVGFPDCEAKRRVGPDAWQSVSIEFEYESRNFRTHGHSAAECDIIVCWVHNWPDCPKGLEVIALSEEIKRLAPAG
jgi:hypothetical protein